MARLWWLLVVVGAEVLAIDFGDFQQEWERCQHNVRDCIDEWRELAEPYTVFTKAGFDVTIASIAGGAVPICA